MGQNLDKFVLITKNSVKFLSSVDHAKCDLLVPPRTKTCPRRQIFKVAVVLPRNMIFCEQYTKIVFLVINLPVNSLNLKFFPVHHITLFVSTFVSFTITGNHESRISEQFSRFWDIHSDQTMNLNEVQDRYRPGQLFLRQQIPQHLSTSDGSFGALSASSTGTSRLLWDCTTA